MGFGVQGTCYEAATTALADACSRLQGQSAELSSAWSCSGIASSSESGGVLNAVFNMVAYPAGGGAATEYTQQLILPACEAYTVADGMTLGWLVGGVWLAAAGMVFLLRGARR